MAQQIKASAAIHLAFDQLELRNLAFDRARAPRQRQRGFHRSGVPLERPGEAAELAAAGEDDAARERTESEFAAAEAYEEQWHEADKERFHEERLP